MNNHIHNGPPITCGKVQAIIHKSRTRKLIVSITGFKPTAGRKRLAECFATSAQLNRRLGFASLFFSRLQSAKEPTGFQPVVIQKVENTKMRWQRMMSFFKSANPVQDISSLEAKRMLDSNERFILLDVRAPEEYRVKHIL